jgi:hypothetical protein
LEALAGTIGLAIPACFESRSFVQIPEPAGFHAERGLARTVIEQDQPQFQMLEIRLVSDQCYFRIRQKFLPGGPRSSATARFEFRQAHAKSLITRWRECNPSGATPASSDLRTARRKASSAEGKNTTKSAGQNGN